MAWSFLTDGEAGLSGMQSSAHTWQTGTIAGAPLQSWVVIPAAHYGKEGSRRAERMKVPLYPLEGDPRG